MTAHPTSVVLIEGCRTPFRRSGTDYLPLIAYDLARQTLTGLLERTTLPKTQVDYVIMGTVAQNVQTSNIARDAALAAGLPNTVPAHTVTQACISANQAITSAAAAIGSNQADVAIAGGVELLSDSPIGLGKKARQKLFQSRKYKKPLEYVGLMKGMRFKEWLPQAPAIAEFSSGEVMGENADKLAAHFGISRAEQDAYALRSHQCAAEATEQGKLKDIVPTALPPAFTVLEQDNTFRADSSLETLAKLKPVFVKPFGTVTAGNSSPLTDGAAATLLMRETYAQAHDYMPKARIKDYVYVAQDPLDELLLGPAYAIPALLERSGLTLADIDVFELHEAFAGQVLAVLAALDSDTFAQQKLNRSTATGSIDTQKLNCWGGSLSLGHPFGATGARLVSMAADRLIAEDGQLALVAACAAGGLGHAMLLERL